MPDTVLKSIEIRNWTKIAHTVIEFPASGLVLVRGENLTGEGKMRSIGSGKTAIGEAISRTLLDVNGRYTMLGYYSPTPKGNTYVKLTCLHKGKELCVESGYKAAELNKDGEGLRYTYDGQQVWRDNMRNTRSDLVKLLTVPPELATWAVHLDGDKLKFADLSQKSSVNLLMSALNQPPWTDYHRKASGTVASLERDLAVDANASEQARNRREDAATDLAEAQRCLVNAKRAHQETVARQKALIDEISVQIEQKTKQFDECKQGRQSLKKKIDRSVNENAERLNEAELDRNSINDRLHVVLEKKADLSGRQRELRNLHQNAQSAYEELVNAPTACPTCGAPLKKGFSEGELRKREQECQKLAEQLSKIETDIQAHGEKTQKIRDQANSAVAEFNRLRQSSNIAEMSREYEQIERTENRINTELSALERRLTAAQQPPDRSEIISAESIITERQRQKVAAETKVQAATSKMAETEMALRVAEFWLRAFGPTGIPNMILRDAITPLNDAAQRISTTMAGGTIRVNYATDRALASGKEKSELNIQVKNDNGASRFEGNSKGEAGLANLVVAETLAEVGQVTSRIGYRWYDEVQANQDELVRCSMFAYMKDLARRYSALIFIVSHSPEAANYADHILVAEKTHKGITYHWER